MSIRNDIKSVFQEFSSIFAGFKLAVIVISYFGLGSVAKWVISHWYPFTRWIWDLFCQYFTLPVFSDVVKDSLTALVFFIPLGITALVEFRRRHEDQNKNTYRFLGAFFGLLFLILICKDAISAIAKAISEAPAVNIDDGLLQIIKIVFKDLDKVPGWVFAVFMIFYVVMAFVASGYLTKNERRRTASLAFIRKISKNSLYIAFVLSSIFGILTFLLTMVGSMYGAGLSILAAIFIIFVVLTILIGAIAFAPRKLFITAGACIAFVLAALCFEIVIFIIEFIETAPV